MQEIWKDIEGYEGMYQVSNLGRVKSFHNTNNRWKSQKERILKNYIGKAGYDAVSLSLNNKRKTCRVHVLVWDAFGDKKRDYPNLQITHIDNNKGNNKIENLQLLNKRQIEIKCHIGQYPTGVSRKNNHSFRYGASIKINKKDVYLGTRSTPEAASELYQNALLRLDE